MTAIQTVFTMKGFVILFICLITELCWSATVEVVTKNPGGGQPWNNGANVVSIMGLKQDICEFKLLNQDQSQTSRGTIMSKHKQYVYGYEVQGYGITLEHFPGNSSWSPFASGKLVKGCEDDLSNQPNISELDLCTIALNKANFMPSNDETDLDPQDNNRFMFKVHVDPINSVCEFVCNLNFLVKKGHIMYEPSDQELEGTDDPTSTSSKGLSHVQMTINANTGEVMSYQDKLQMYSMKGDGGNINEGIYRYGEGRWWNRMLNTTMLDHNLCEMQNSKTLTASAQGIDIFPPNHCFNESLYSPYTECCNPLTSTDPTATSVSQVHDAHYFATRFQEMLFELYGDTTIPDCCGQVRVCVHHGPVDNAYIYNTGHCETYYGDGLNYFTGLATSDVVAHELGHAIIQCTSQLEYECQPGGMNEAFADMCGMMFKAFLNNYQSNFMIGHTTIKDLSIGDALRYMDDPPRDRNSIDCSQDYECQNVHFTSGVYNKAFYNLVMMEHWNFRNAYEIFLRANKLYWLPLTGFDEGLCGLIQAAYDLDYSGDDVREAFAKVGVFCACPEGWYPRKNGTDKQGNSCKTCYKFVHVLASWAEAREYCQALESDLVSLEDQWGTEIDWVYEHLTNVSAEHMLFCRTPDYWIGGMDMKEEGNWHWIPTDQPIDITDWMTGEPDNYLGNQHCAALSQNHGDEWKWIDDDCVRKKFFICEMSCYGLPSRAY